MSVFLSDPAAADGMFYYSAGSISSYSYSSVASEDESHLPIPPTESEEWPDSVKAQVILYEEHTPVVLTSTGTDPMQPVLTPAEQEALLALLRSIKPEATKSTELLENLRGEVEALLQKVAALTEENNRLRTVPGLPQRKSHRTDNLLLTTNGQTVNFEEILHDLRTASRKASRALRASAHRKKASHQRSPVKLMGSVRLNLNPLLH